MASDYRLKEQLPELTDRIVETYTTTPEIHHLGHCPLPKHGVIISVLQDLKEIIFPGYQNRENLHIGNVTYHVGDLIDGLHDKLTAQIARALLHDARRNGADPCDDKIDYEAKGQGIALEFLESIPELRRLLATDVQAAYDGDPACRGLDEVIFCYPGLDAVTVHRIAHEFYKLDVPFIPRMMAEWSHKQTGIDIHPGARIGKSFFIDHGTGVVICQTCEIGDRVKIYQGVTLGALSFPTDESGALIRDAKRHPTIENDVVIYANATVLGGKTVLGAGSVVGSSVWLTHSVDPGTTVLMEKPDLRMRNDVPDELNPEANYQI
ncbi:MAG: serine acetyltransferase [bacterium]|nr:serine acetyltransferase [bacterium]